MKDQTEYDAFCKEKKCLAEKNSFFRFHLQDKHILEHHDVEGIVPVTFLKFLQAGRTKSSHMNSQLVQLSASIDASIMEIGKFLREKIFNRYMGMAQQIVRKGDICDINTFTKGMKEGNYDFLSAYIQFKENGSSNLKEDSKRLIETDLSRISVQIEAKKRELMNLLMKTVQNDQERVEKETKEKKDGNVNNFQQIQLSKYFKNKSQIEVEMISEQFNHMKNIKIEDKPQPIEFQPENNINNVMMEEIQISEDSSESESSPEKRSVDKHKLIEKSNKKEDRKIKKRNRRPYMSNINLMSSCGLVIKEIFTIKSTYKSIINIDPKVTKIHIFDQQFYNSKVITTLLRQFPTIEVLTINCSKVLKDFPSEKLRNLKRLCLRWDLQYFYQEYFLSKYFQINKKRNVVDNFIGAISNSVNNNEHLWLSSPIQFEENKIVTKIHPQVQSCELYLKWVDRPEIQVIRSLRSLKINQLYDEKTFGSFLGLLRFSKKMDQNLSKVISRNTQLQSVFLGNRAYYEDFKGKQMPYEIVPKTQRINFFPQTFWELSHLSGLKVFSLCPNQEIKLKISKITNLKNLEHLFLEKIKFVEDDEEDGNSALDQKFLANFNNLKSLSLYGCLDVESKHINKLSPACFDSLEFLNLGRTRVDKNCMGTISKLKNLLYLQLQYVKIRGEDLLKMSHDYQNNFSTKHPLLKLNVEAERAEWTAMVFSLIKKKWKQKNEKRQPELTEKDRKPDLKIQMQKSPESNEIQHKKLSFQDELWCVHTIREGTESIMAWTIKKQILANIFSAEQIEEMSVCFPKLEYLNLTNHFNYVNVDFSKFNSLRTLVKDSIIDNSDLKTPPFKTKVVNSIKGYQEEDYSIRLTDITSMINEEKRSPFYRNSST